MLNIFKLPAFITGMRENTSLMGILDSVKKYCIYALVFLMPVFFLPWLFDGVDFNKQALLSVLAFVALFAWIIKTLVFGSLDFHFNKIHLAVGALFLVYAVSTVFSVSPQGSFWGWPQVTSASLLSMLCLCIVYFLVSTTFSEKEVFDSFVILGISAALAQFYGILQMMGWHIVPLDFAKASSFNTIGSTGSLALFSSALLPFSIIFAISSTRWKKWLFSLNILLAFLVVLLVNYYFIWILVAVSSLLLIVFWFFRKDFFSGKWLFLPMFFLIISLFFFIFKPQLKWLPQKPLEISMSNKATWQVDVSALKKSPLIGSGPGTFIYDFEMFRNQSFNKGPLWDVEFNSGSSKVLTDVATVGILGVLALFTVALYAFWYAITSTLVGALANASVSKSQKNSGEMPLRQALILSIGIVMATQTVGYFFYNTNLSLSFLWFLCIGSLAALIFNDRKKHVLKSSSPALLAVTFLFTAAIIFGSGFLMFQGQRYYASTYYYRAISAYNEGKKEEAISHIKIAASNNKNVDLYFRQLAMFSIGVLRDKITGVGNTAPTAEDKAKVANFISDSVNAANGAININPKNVANWSTKGYVCQNLIGFTNDAVACAVDSYAKALELYPTNPYLPFQQGNVYVAQAEALVRGKSQAEQASLAPQRSAMLKTAIERYKKAIELKTDYAAVYLQLARVQRADGDSAGYAASMENAVKYSQQDAALSYQAGILYYQDQNWVKAQAQFTRALALLPNYANALYYSGLAYDKLGQKDNAITQFSKILQANPGSQSVQKIVENLKAGKPALDGVEPQPVAPEPAVEAPSSVSEPKQ